MSISPHNSAYNLYCNELAMDVVVSSDADTCNYDHHPVTFDSPTDDDHSWIVSIFEAELDHMPGPDVLRLFRRLPMVATARQDAIKWMMNVHAYYNFRPTTAYLSVNYLDRFLSCHALTQGKGWPWQLLSVACVALAAKMEETTVPLLLDLQVIEPRFVFKPRTVQRMELLVMASLNWRLRVVTPFDFLDYLIAKLSCFGSPFDHELFSSASNLILTTCQVIDFLDYPPSTIAAATVLWAAGQNFDDQKKGFFHERVSTEMVKRCLDLFKHHLMINKSHLAHIRQQRLELLPSSPPVGVLHAAGSSSVTQKFGLDDSK